VSGITVDDLVTVTLNVCSVWFDIKMGKH